MLPPTILKSADIIKPEDLEVSLKFGALVKETQPTIKQLTNPNSVLAKEHLESTLKGMQEVSWLGKISNPTLHFFTKETDIHKQAIKQCLDDSQKKGEEAQENIQQAQTSLQSLTKELEKTQTEWENLNQLRKDAAVNIPLLQKEINKNTADIKAAEPILGSAITKIYYSALSAQAIDPTLIKQPINLKQQPMEVLVLNKDKYINNTEIFLKASQIVQENSAYRNELKQSLSEKLTTYENIKMAHEAFKKTLPSDFSKFTPEQVNEAAQRGEALKKAIQEYEQLKKQLNTQLEQAKEYLKYHDIWSKQTQEEIDTAKLIESKKQENLKLSQTIDQIMDQTSDQKLGLLTDKLQALETEIQAQEKITSDNQALLKTQQDFATYFQEEAQRLDAPAKSDMQVELSALPTHFMPELTVEKIITIAGMDLHP